MKFWAKVRFKEEENAEHLIRSFFTEFNSENSIVIRGNEAKVEIIFDNPPMEIIEAINHCDVIEFNCGKTLGEYKKDETEQVRKKEETSEQTEQAVAEEETSEQTEQAVVEEETSEQTEQAEAKKDNPENSKNPSKKEDEIPELSELAKKSSSYEEFVKSVASWLEMDKKKEFFQSIVRAAGQAKKITWSNIEEILKSDGVNYKEWDKIWCTKKVTSKFKNSETSVTIMKLIKVIVEYKTYDFNQEVRGEMKELAEETSGQTEQAVAEEKTDEQTETINEVAAPKKRVKMECMPEIPYFEEVLGSVDKTQPIEKRVKYVLTAMGLKKMKTKEQHEIFEITNTAVRLGRMDFDIIFLKAKIPLEESMTARMTFSKFINDFVKEYYSDKKVKLLDFLKDMQRIVMFESEIESFTDFTD